MDPYAAAMTVRGPTLGPDRETWTGSLHVVDLPDAAAARRFAEEEPYNRAGLFAEHLVLRYEDRLGRTMWQAPADHQDEPAFLVVARETPLGTADVEASRLIAHGDLFDPDGTGPAGAMLVLRASGRDEIGDRFGGPGVEIHDWEPGGRR